MHKTTMAALAAATLMLPGCASIISGSTDDVSVSTSPPGADCTLYREGKNIGRINPTPGTVQVSRSWQDIIAECKKDGYDVANATAASGLNGWVFGNIIFGLLGGPIGAAIDSGTAAATGYDDEVWVSLSPTAAPEPQPEAQPAPMANREEGTPTS